MRLFVALEIPPAVRANLIALIKSFREMAPDLRWVRVENLHVTLKFLGEAAPEKLDGIRNALASVRAGSSVQLDFRGLGFFPNGKRPRVFWAGIEASPDLKTLVSGIDLALEKTGFPREQRPFEPHLTLARIETRGLSEKLRAAIAENAARDFGAFATNQFHLIESKLKPGGSEYTTLQVFPFWVAEA